MKRFTLSFAAIVAIAAISNSAENANAQLRDTISRVLPQRMPFQGSQQQPSSCSSRPSAQPTQPVYRQPPVYAQPPVYRQPVYAQPMYQQPVYTQPVMAQPVAANPVVVSPTPTAPNASASKARAKQLANVAKQQFRSNQYGKAKATLDKLVKLVPNDSSAWQFRGIVSFSMGDFEDAAADIYDALRLGKAWPRKSIAGLYGDYEGNYAIQLVKLNESVSQKPSMQGHFLQAYHHMVNEQLAEGKQELQNVLKLEPNEPLTKKLMVALDQQLARK